MMDTLLFGLMHEGDASFTVGHLLVAHTKSVTSIVIATCDGHKLSSRLVREGDASFLAGHLWLACFTLLG